MREPLPDGFAEFCLALMAFGFVATFVVFWLLGWLPCQQGGPEDKTRVDGRGLGHGPWK